MIERLLLPTQKNTILQLMEKVGINPLEFDFDKCESQLGSKVKVSVLRHKATKFYFVFDFSRTNERYHNIKYYPTKDGKTITLLQDNFDLILKEFIDRLFVVKRESTAPDLWAAIAGQRQLFEAVPIKELENELFTQTEQKYISEQLELIEHQITEILKNQGKTEQIKEATKSIDYLKEASTNYLGGIGKLLLLDKQLKC